VIVRLHRAASGILALGLSLTAAGCAAVALAQAGSAPSPVTEPEMRAFVYERMAAALLLLVAAIWGAIWKFASAVKGYIEGLKKSVTDSAADFRAGFERLAEALVEHNESPHSHRDLRDTMRERTDRALDAIDDLLRRQPRDPSDSPVRRRHSDPAGEDHAGERGSR
jgi:hypothetical protein